MTREEKKRHRQEKKRLARERDSFDLKLARRYGLDKEDLTEQQREIFANANNFHRSAFAVADQAETPSQRASLIALAEHAIITVCSLPTTRGRMIRLQGSFAK